MDDRIVQKFSPKEKKIGLFSIGQGIDRRSFENPAEYCDSQNGAVINSASNATNDSIANLK